MLALQQRGIFIPKLRPKSDPQVHLLVDDLLREIYGNEHRRHSTSLDSDTGTAEWSCSESVSSVGLTNREQFINSLQDKGDAELKRLINNLKFRIEQAGGLLVRQLRRRDAFLLRHTRHCDIITALLQAQSLKRRQDTRLRFSVAPLPGDSGFTQWHDAMKMVARLPGGIPQEFRRRLWLTLAEKHLQARGVDWTQTERTIFNEWSNPDDDELGIQIVKDLHRTGCSLFCGAAGERNQALLKRVLLAYARWNKAVGYCQGFNMLAALILQVMERSEADSVKVMIYLIEGVLPESYFANNLRGLSVDMAVFRELLRMRLPSLSKHLEQLQSEAGDLATGTSYEPPLTNVFTMQWFLTLFANCLPQATVLRVWDLVFLEGNEVLLRAALAIWASLQERIMAVESADEFYSIMGVLTREMLEFGLMDPNNLIKAMVTVAPFPFPELPELRDRYTYNITPWSHSVSNAARRGLRLFQSDDDEVDDEDPADDEKMAVAAAFGISAVFRSSPRRRTSLSLNPALGAGGGAPDKDRLNLDISALKQQYSKLRERQRQAHIILTAACARQPGPTRQVATQSSAPVVMNHLLLGRSAILQGVRRSTGPMSASTAMQQPRPSRQPVKQIKATAESGETLHWRDAKRRPSESIVVTTKSPSPERIQRQRSSSSSSTTSSASQGSSSSTELCDEPDRLSDFDLDEDKSLKKPSEIPIVQTSDVSPPSELSSPTGTASTHDQISQISLTPILLSPSSSTLQNSPTSTLQGSPLSESSKTIELPSPNQSQPESTTITPSISPSAFTTDLSPYTLNKSSSMDQATSPIDWSVMYNSSENSPDLIKSHVIESPLIQLEENVFSHDVTQEHATPSPLRIVPLGSLSASLSSPSSNEDDLNLPDLMVITPPRELSPLSPLKSPPQWAETVQWDATKFPFPKSPVKTWETEQINKSNENLISWDIPDAKKDGEWGKYATDWKKDDEWKDNSTENLEWPKSEVRESASDAPASPLSAIQSESWKSENKDWIPQFPKLPETPSDKPENSWHSLSPQNKINDKLDVADGIDEASWHSASPQYLERQSISPQFPTLSESDTDIHESDRNVIYSPQTSGKFMSFSPEQSTAAAGINIESDIKNINFSSDSSEINFGFDSPANKSPIHSKPETFCLENLSPQHSKIPCFSSIESVESPTKQSVHYFYEKSGESTPVTSPKKDRGVRFSVDETVNPIMSPMQSSPKKAYETSVRFRSFGDTVDTPSPSSPKNSKEKGVRFGASQEATNSPSEVSMRHDKNEPGESRRLDRKRWTIAEPIAWSDICDAISQQQETQQQNLERPASPLVEEEEEKETPPPVGAIGRRNSERALQIIQENSEILQRIMRESRGKQMMDRETRASRPTSIGLGGSRACVKWSSQRELASEASPPPQATESPTYSANLKPGTCFPSLGESPQTSPAPFNPFPVRPKPQTRELGVRLGLYPTKTISK